MSMAEVKELMYSKINNQRDMNKVRNIVAKVETKEQLYEVFKKQFGEGEE